jgi:pseudaminic acid biosynthesis-associated methylase
MSTTEFWAGPFGDEYIERNRFEWQKRARFWNRVIPQDVKTILEAGCNIGNNLKAIRATRQISAVGVDVNQKAIDWAAQFCFEVHNVPGADIAQRFGPASFDLVFTSGVLIHIAPEDLDQVMAAIVETSKRYVLAVEYADEVETAVTYRGFDDKLWRRPFGQLYQSMGMTLLDSGPAGTEDGFDECTWWLLEKT